MPTQSYKKRKKLHAWQDGLCIYCKNPVTFELSTLDHLVPKSKEGSNLLSNLVMACSTCNLIAANFKTIEELDIYYEKAKRIVTIKEKLIQENLQAQLG